MTWQAIRFLPKWRAVLKMLARLFRIEHVWQMLFTSTKKETSRQRVFLSDFYIHKFTKQFFIATRKELRDLPDLNKIMPSKNFRGNKDERRRWGGKLEQTFKQSSAARQVCSFSFFVPCIHLAVCLLSNRTQKMSTSRRSFCRPQACIIFLHTVENHFHLLFTTRK